MAELDDIAKEFLVESYENLDQLDQDFVVLEEDPKDLERLNSIFRTVHTIKGTCGFLGFFKLESITHVGENLLGKLRDGTLTLNDSMTSALLKLVDAIREILSSLEQTGEEGQTDYTDLIQQLTSFLEDTPLPQDGGPEQITQPSDPQEAPTTAETNNPDPVQQTLESEATPAASAAAPTQSSGSSVADAAIRVDVSLLDNLMNLVGELVLTRNQVMQHAQDYRNETLGKTIGQLNHITTELQEQVMKTRMQPISTVWNKFPRVVRDLSHSVEKDIRLEMEGKETELDKSLLEAIKDPLTHIVRNSVDHGIESPADREAAGKPRQGLLKLKAYQEGGFIAIEIIDDGGGIHPEKVKTKAIEKGLISAEQAAAMGDREAQLLIFKAGFSTAAEVTNISGRGVGMDVVRTNIEKTGGSIEVQSEVGQGTTLILRIPLTLAIIPALTVSCGDQRFSLPQSSLKEVVRLEKGKSESKIETIYGAPVYRLRDQLLPVIHLNAELGVGNTELNHEDANLVVLQTEDSSFGLVVDAIGDTQEIVVKPLDKVLESLGHYAGATILGDGRVSLILDVSGLALKAQVVQDDQQDKTQEQADGVRVERQPMLLFKVRDNGRMVLPLSQVERVDEVPTETVEHVGGRLLLQHQGKIIPIIKVFDVLPERRNETRNEEDHQATTQVVIYNHRDKRIGLSMGTVLDSLDANLAEKGPSTREGVLGTLVVGERVTEILDIEKLIEMVGSGYFDGTTAA